MMTRTHRSVFAHLSVGLAFIVAPLGARVATAQALATPERSQYTPLDAAADAMDRHEARRLGQINAQIGLNQQMRWRWTGLSSFYPGAFEAWPMIPGDIWGYPLPIFNVRQSIGQRSYQAGPNRWISEPVYPEDLSQGGASPDPRSPYAGGGPFAPGASAPPAAPQADPTDLFGGPAPPIGGAAPFGGPAPFGGAAPAPSQGPREF
jgi:hypothetical protein